MPRTCLLFDLDGTLIDSLPDLSTAINLLRADENLAPLTDLQVRNFVGDGARALVKRALPEDSFVPEKLASFLSYYQQHLCEKSTPYPGICELLDKLHSFPMAVVTNKPKIMATELLDKLQLSKYFQLVIGGDSYHQKKPDPTPINEALLLLNADQQTSIMIGDHHTDLRAAKAAGISACFCSWGYGNDGNDRPDFSASTVAELYPILANR